MPFLVDWIEQSMGHKFKLRLVLFDPVKPIEFTARKERQSCRTGSTCWSLSIQEEDERHFTVVIEQIADYVMARQRTKRSGDE